MVEGLQGRPGGGKTAAAVALAFKAKERGRAVYANIPLIDRRQIKRREYHFFGKLTVKPKNAGTFGQMWSDGLLENLEQALALDNALVLLDEVHMWMGADQWAKIPFEVRRYLAQQRKIGIDIWWTAQSNARVFNVLRELTAKLWTCQRFAMVSRQTAVDPESREKLGNRWVLLGPHVWHLYDTEYMVGDASGETAGRYGRNDRYHRTGSENDSASGSCDRLGAINDALERFAFEPDGRVLYRWRDQRLTGEDDQGAGAGVLA